MSGLEATHHFSTLSYFAYIFHHLGFHLEWLVHTSSSASTNKYQWDSNRQVGNFVSIPVEFKEE